VDHPGNFGGSDSWEDAGPWRHSGSIPKYPDELRERAVKMVSEIRDRDGKGHGELARVGRQLGIHPEALRSWVKQAEIDGDERPGTTTGDKQRIAELERENRELRRANVL